MSSIYRASTIPALIAAGRDAAPAIGAPERTGLTHQGLRDLAQRTIAALKICAQHIARSGATHVRAIATQAARLAGNADVLIARARAEAGIALEVISSEAAADLAALGCAPLIGSKYKGALIFDIGGGSTEFIVGVGRAPGFHVSLPVGVVRMSERHVHTDPPARTSRRGTSAAPLPRP